MEYKVIKSFFDIQDNDHRYYEGDTFPRDGYEPSQERIDTLLSSNNAYLCPFIEEVKEVKKTRKGAQEDKTKVGG